MISWPIFVCIVPVVSSLSIVSRLDFNHAAVNLGENLEEKICDQLCPGGTPTVLKNEITLPYIPLRQMTLFYEWMPFLTCYI